MVMVWLEGGQGEVKGAPPPPATNPPRAPPPPPPPRGLRPTVSWGSSWRPEPRGRPPPPPRGIEAFLGVQPYRHPQACCRCICATNGPGCNTLSCVPRFVERFWASSPHALWLLHGHFPEGLDWSGGQPTDAHQLLQEDVVRGAVDVCTGHQQEGSARRPCPFGAREEEVGLRSTQFGYV